MTDPRSGFSDNLILWELQKVHDALTKTKEKHTLNFRMIKPTEVNLYLILTLVNLYLIKQN